MNRVHSMEEIEAEYAKFLATSEERTLDLAEWLPSLRREGVRPLVPGELCFIMGDTGVGKSLAIAEISRTTVLPSILFEMELPRILMFERYMQAIWQRTGPEIEAAFIANEYHPFPPENIYVCDLTRLSIGAMKEIMEKDFPSVQRNGLPPEIVFVDYIGLMSASGKSRHERVSSAAEDLKVLAKETNTIVVAATQMHRKEDSDEEPGLHDARDSSSIENSAGLLLGMWRDKNEPGKTLWVKVLKNTKGGNGGIVKCRIDGAHMRITEDERKLSEDELRDIGADD